MCLVARKFSPGFKIRPTPHGEDQLRQIGNPKKLKEIPVTGAMAKSLNRLQEGRVAIQRLNLTDFALQRKLEQLLMEKNALNECLRFVRENANKSKLTLINAQVLAILIERGFGRSLTRVVGSGKSSAREWTQLVTLAEAERKGRFYGHRISLPPKLWKALLRSALREVIGEENKLFWGVK